MVRGKRVLAGVVSIGLLLMSAAGASASVTSKAAFLDTWNIGGGPKIATASNLALDDYAGTVYVLQLRYGIDQFRVLRYHPDGTALPFFSFNGGTTGGIAWRNGVILVARVGEVRRFTPGGGYLGSLPAPRLLGTDLAIDGAGHLYGTGTTATGAAAINEYSVGGRKLTLVHSAPYPGTPDDGYNPANFLGIAVDAAGNAYGSGQTASLASPTHRFILRFAAGLAGPPTYLLECSQFSCYQGFGLAVQRTLVSGLHEDRVYSGLGNDDTSSPHTGVGVLDPLGGYTGEFGPHALLGNPSVESAQPAASPCNDDLFVLNTVFGGPGGTFSSQEIQRWSVGAETRPCAAPKASISIKPKRFRLIEPVAGAKRPCATCAVFKRSGKFPPGPANPGKRGGVKLSFKSTAEAIVRFSFRRHGKKLGGFAFPALEGSNGLRFSGVLRKPLPDGLYRVKVTGGGSADRFRLRIGL
jgi:hypothetical protein